MTGLATALSVLMVGHSLFGPIAPVMLEQALLAGTGQGQVAAQIINGAPLRYNWENASDAQGVDARATLPTGETTHLILTEAVPLANHLQWSETDVYARAFANLAKQANPDVQVYVQETWHSLKSGTGSEVEYDAGANVPWRDRLDQDLPAWEGIVADLAPHGNVSLIPAGQAMALLYDDIAAGAVPGLSDIEGLFDDDIHLNDTGHYFVTMVQYATLTGLDPLGLPRDFNDRFGAAFDTPDEDLARELQRVAWAAVQAYAAVSGQKTVQRVAPAQTTPQAPRAPPETPIAEVLQKTQEATPGSGAVAIGLASVTDWSPQQPFLDLMKTARPWIGHRPGQWGGMELDALREGGFLDSDGWPTQMPRSLSSIGTLILTDMPTGATSLQGRYRLQFDGTGVVEVKGRASNIRYATGEVRFDYTPGPGSVEIRIQRINPSDPPRNITVVAETQTGAYDAGARFNPQWTGRIGKFSALRFMDWLETNNASLGSWDERPLPGDMTYAPGVPIEVLIALANEVQRDVWINVPHLADDAFVRAFAELVRDGLDPGLKVYVEFSNEVWNWQFDQARWADARATERWGQRDKWMQYYGFRAAEVAQIWSDVFADVEEARLINVISSQTGWLGLENEVLNAPLAVAEGLAAPAQAFDAYAVTGYFGGVLGLENRAGMVKGWLRESLTQAQGRASEQGLTGEDAAQYIAKYRYDLASALAGRELMDGAVSGNAEDTLADLIGRVLPHHAAIARDYGLELIMYEGGSHVVGIGGQVEDAELTEFFHHFNYSAEMGALYQTLLAGWQGLGGQLFNAYSDVYAPTKWGSWGALRHLDDQNPRWDALVAVQ